MPIQAFEDDFRKAGRLRGKIPFLVASQFVKMVGADRFGPRCVMRLVAPCGDLPAGTEYIAHVHHYDARAPYSRQRKHAHHEPAWIQAMSALGY